ncbi:beta-adaptin-like protein A [Dorcoceras hygrometricum]|uniref:Beta-adaptin-like protein A n=1 Tax=Dorcoceras hygrometricum TaxID=472368 RepID=A0A2Z7AXD2_9LAMI|nr:beta-adaptin-like protein A [Dorcoceras hygrometricum]
MSLFDLQDVCTVIRSLATLDLPMVVDLIGTFVLKGPYCTLTMTDWFLQTLSVIPRGSWGDVARRFTMIRWAAVDRQSGPRPDSRHLRQSALEGLTNSARTETPRQADRNKSDHGKRQRHTAAQGGGQPRALATRTELNSIRNAHPKAHASRRTHVQTFLKKLRTPAASRFHTSANTTSQLGSKRKSYAREIQRH